MADVVQELVVKFGTETTELIAGMQKAESLIKGAALRITKVLGAIGAARLAKQAFSSYIKSADALGKFADSVGENVSVIDAWGLAVRQAGGTAEGFQASVDNLARGLNQVAFTGKGRAKAGLEAFGISVKDAQGNARKATDIMMELAGKAETMSKEQFRGLAQTLGIDKGTIMLLQQGRKSVQELVKEMKGMAISERDAEVAAEFNTAWQNLATSFQRVAAILFRALTPAFTKMAKVFTVFATFLKDHEAIVLTFFSGLALIVSRKVVPAFLRWAAAVLINPITWIIFAIVAGLILVGLAIDDVITYFKGGDSVIGRFLATMSKIFEDLNWENFKAEMKALVQAFKDFWTEIKAMAGRIVDGIKDKISSAINAVKGLITGLIEEVKKAIDWITNSKLGKAVSAAGSVLGKIGGAVSSVFSTDNSAGNVASSLLLPPGFGKSNQNISADNNVNVDTINISVSDTATAQNIAGGFVTAVNNEIPRRTTNRIGTPIRAY